MIPVLRPTIDDQTKWDMLGVLDSGWWGQGPKVQELEEKFATLVGAKYAIATNSCTSALDLCLKAYDITEGELITSPMTFVADAIVGEWNGMEVTFGDIDPYTLCLDPERVIFAQGNPHNSVIITVNSHGRLANIKDLPEVRLIIEDCAHALYTQKAGSQGDIAVWSFQAVKTVPAGDGGMITTNDPEIARKLRNLSWLGVEKSTYSRTQGKKYSWDYDITHGGTKSYMNDLTAVLVLGQLRRLNHILERRCEIQARYNDAFKNTRIHTPQWSETCQYYTVQMDKRDEMSEILAENGIATSVHFKPLNEMTYWKKAAKFDLPVTNEIWPKLLTFPCHDGLADEEQDYVIKKVKENL